MHNILFNKFLVSYDIYFNTSRNKHILLNYLKLQLKLPKEQLINIQYGCLCSNFQKLKSNICHQNKKNI